MCEQYGFPAQACLRDCPPHTEETLTQKLWSSKFDHKETVQTSHEQIKQSGYQAKNILESIMANEREPDDPLPVDFVPDGSIATHRVSDGEDWAKVAAKYQIEKVWDLIYFNFHTYVPEEVNWYLRRNTGCNVSKDGGRNWAFSSSADPGLIHIPPVGVINMPEDVIEVDPRSTMERLQEISKTIPGNEGIRIREMIDIAVLVDFPRAAALWYYDRTAVHSYVSLHTSDIERRQMTLATNGQFPFDGKWGPTPTDIWKKTPFLEIVTLDNTWLDYSIQRAEDSQLEKALYDFEWEMNQSWRDMQGVDARSALGGGPAWGPLVDAFLNHVHSLAADPTHLYFVYQEH
jgi:hypothetical protein